MRRVREREFFLVESLVERLHLAKSEPALIPIVGSCVSNDLADYV